MVEFKNIEFLWLLILILPLFYFIKNRVNDLNDIFKKEVISKVKVSSKSISKKVKSILLILSLVFMIIALARPIIKDGEITVKSSFINMIVGIDMSKSMFANDIYPNRFEFAKMKFYDMLPLVENMKIALLGFSSQTFLISPLTEDFHSLRYLSENLNLENVTLKGTSIITTLKSANDMFGDEKKKIVLLFTDGGDNKDLQKEIEYAKNNNIVVYIYNIGTQKGGIIEDENGILKDDKGDIVVVKLNKYIKELAIQTDGGYMEYSLKRDDIKLLINSIENKFKPKDESSSTIEDSKEIFWLPLIFSLLLFFISIFSIPLLNSKGAKV
ncbi:MAG: VWA domain-containing protein [Campylobacterota bacterium]|nr:VWA domain-containing protein [Campylobacterota bacterium]